jgi:hypothetical protein
MSLVLVRITSFTQIVTALHIPKMVYTIPFTKKAVDDALENEHPFGPDSLNVTDKASVIYHGKFENILGVQNFRCGDYTYDQFIVPEWKQFVQLAIQEGGPQKRKYYEEPPRYYA